MPTSTRTPGSNLNPSQKDSDDKFNDITQNSPEYPNVEKGLRDLENFNRDNAADVDKSIAEKEQEPSGNWKDNTTGTNKSEPSLKDRAKDFEKARGYYWAYWRSGYWRYLGRVIPSTIFTPYKPNGESLKHK